MWTQYSIKLSEVGEGACEIEWKCIKGIGVGREAGEEGYFLWREVGSEVCVGIWQGLGVLVIRMDT